MIQFRVDINYVSYVLVSSLNVEQWMGLVLALKKKRIEKIKQLSPALNCWLVFFLQPSPFYIIVMYIYIHLHHSLSYMEI